MYGGWSPRLAGGALLMQSAATARPTSASDAIRDRPSPRATAAALPKATLP